MNVASGLRKVFNFLAEKVCFSFAVAAFSLLGALVGVPGFIYMEATIDHSLSAHTLPGDIALSIVMLSIMAVAHACLYGLPRLWGRRWELMHLRHLNDHLNKGLFIPVEISTPDLSKASRVLERLPGHNATTAAILASPLVLLAVIRETLSSGSWHNSLAALGGGLIAWTLYVIFTFLITEIVTTEARRDARWFLAMREAWEPPRHAVSLKIKFAFFIGLLLISVVITHGISASPAIHDHMAAISIFTAMILAVGLALCILIFVSIRNTLMEIRQTALDLPEAHSAQFLSGSIDREFIETAAGLYQASLKIIEYRDTLQTLNTELEEKVQERTAEIKLLSITDALTGCYNRGYLTETLAKEIKQARRYEHPLSIVMCDLDHFKRVNDTFGHQAGDQVLCEFVACIKGLYRSDLDWLARYGGEEFLIVLPETGYQGAERMAERVRRSIAQREIMLGSSQITITASFGVTGFNAHTPVAKLIPEAMINQADQNLYQAKHEGRNRIVSGAL